jgi:Tfp pilus assembly protein PilO
MKRLPPAKRNQLIMVVAATIIAVSLVFFLMISPQKEKNEILGVKIRTEKDKLQTIKNALKKTEDIASSLTEISLQLNHAEDDVASGDVYAWTYDALRRFKAAYHVDIPNIAQPSVTDVDLLPGFPYRQVKVTLAGTAFYHDLGKFIADLENTFPHMRVVNLSIEPASMTGVNSERLSFRVDVIALVKPNT